MKDVNAINDVCMELTSAMERYPALGSYHEGWAVILEEVDELWDEVKLKPLLRNPEKLRAEAMQIAAMALRFMIDLT